MRMSLRLVFSLIVGVTVLSYLFALFQVRAEKRALRKELTNRAEILAESLEGNVEPLLLLREKGSRRRLQTFVTDFGNRERVTGIAVLDTSGNTLAQTPGLENYLDGELPTISQVISSNLSYSGFTTLNLKPTHLYVLPLHDESGVVGALAIFQDAGYIDAQASKLWRDTFLRALAQAAFITLVTLLIIRWSIVGPLARTAKWVRELRAGNGVGRSSLEEEDLFKPLAQEVTHLAKSLEAARAAAE